jgi:hypothetical protein
VLTVTTFRLPHEFLFPAGTLLPRNVLTALGTVNRYPMFGGSYPAGTLLYPGTKMQRKRWSMRAAGESAWLWSVEHLFSFFDPDKGLTGSGLVQITTRRGHVNCPFRGR